MVLTMWHENRFLTYSLGKHTTDIVYSYFGASVHRSHIHVYAYIRIQKLFTGLFSYLLEKFNLGLHNNDESALHFQNLLYLDGFYAHVLLVCAILSIRIHFKLRPSSSKNTSLRLSLCLSHHFHNDSLIVSSWNFQFLPQTKRDIHA